MADDSDVSLSEMLPTERIGLTLWLILTWEDRHGESPTAMDLAAAVDIADGSMRRMLNKLSRVVPIYPSRGRWHYAKGPSRPAPSAMVET